MILVTTHGADLAVNFLLMTRAAIGWRALQVANVTVDVGDYIDDKPLFMESLGTWNKAD